jgi:hypothetical protein
VAELALKAAAALKAEWVRQEQVRRERAAREEFETKLTVYNAERATKGLKPLEIGEQLDPKSFDVNKDLDAFTAAQANRSFLHAFGQTFEELTAGFEAYEVDQLTSKIDRAKEAFKGDDLDAKFHASRALSSLTKGELELARKNGVRLDDSTIEQAGGEVQYFHRAQAESLYGTDDGSDLIHPRAVTLSRMAAPSRIQGVLVKVGPLPCKHAGCPRPPPRPGEGELSRAEGVRPAMSPGRRSRRGCSLWPSGPQPGPCHRCHRAVPTLGRPEQAAGPSVPHQPG